MTSVVKEKVTMVFNSSTADSVYKNGSEFRVVFNQPLALPKNCHNPLLSVIESDVFNVVPNLTATSTLLISGLTGSDVTVSFEKGIYNLSDINDRISRELKRNGYEEGLYKLEADTTLGKVVHVFNDGVTTGSATTVNYATANTALQTLLGETANVTAPNANYFYQEGTNIALFNNTRYLLIHSDIISDGIAQNGNFFQIVGKHLLNASPGAQSVYEPEHRSYIPCENLKGNGKSSIRVWLTDQDNNEIEMSEPWSVNMEIQYDNVLITKEITK